MSALEDAERAIASLTQAEKAQLLDRLVPELDDSFPGIEVRSDVSGGEPCIVRTRIPVWVLEQARRLGSSEADILRSYPTLRKSDLAAASIFVRAHREMIEQEIRDNEAA